MSKQHLTTFRAMWLLLIDVLRTSAPAKRRATRTVRLENRQRQAHCRSSAISTSTARSKVETEVKIPFGDEWKLTVNYTYNDSRDLSNGGDKPLQTLPFHTANGTLNWKPLDDWSFYVTANYTAQQRAVSATGKRGRLHPV